MQPYVGVSVDDNPDNDQYLFLSRILAVAIQVMLQVTTVQELLPESVQEVDSIIIWLCYTTATTVVDDTLLYTFTAFNGFIVKQEQMLFLYWYIVKC